MHEREQLELTVVLPATPERVMQAWLDSAEHTAMTGGQAYVEARVGGRHSAWDGYIDGEILELEAPYRLVQSWRTDEFGPEDPDSRLEVRCEPCDGGTELTIKHTSLPEGGAAKYGDGWRQFYFEPMARYFGRPTAGLAEAALEPLPVEPPAMPVEPPMPAPPARVVAPAPAPRPAAAASKPQPAVKAPAKKAAPKKAAAKKAPKKVAKKPAPKKAAKKPAKKVARRPARRAAASRAIKKPKSKGR